MEELYIVAELQKNGNQLSTLMTEYTSRQDAYYKFHTVAALAAISEVEKHVVCIFNEEGSLIEIATFIHTEEDTSAPEGNFIDPADIEEDEEIEEPSYLYLVVEYQINDEANGKIVTQHNNLEEANIKFNNVSAIAALSSVKRHLVLLLGEDGYPVKNVVFVHNN